MECPDANREKTFIHMLSGTWDGARIGSRRPRPITLRTPKINAYAATGRFKLASDELEEFRQAIDMKASKLSCYWEVWRVP